MPKSGAENQAAYRQRVRDRRAAVDAVSERRGDALRQIVDRLEGNDRALAVELRAIAEEGLS